MFLTPKIKLHSAFLIGLNILLQISAFCLMKFSSLQHHHSIFKIINFFTLLAISAVLIRAAVWQTILKLNSLSKSYLCNAVVPFLLLLASHFLFKENITTFNLLGSLIVFTGLLLLFKSMTANQ